MGLFLALTLLSAVVPAWYTFKLGGHDKSTFPAHWVCDLFGIYFQIAAALFFVARMAPAARDLQAYKELFQDDDAPPPKTICQHMGCGNSAEEEGDGAR